MNKVYKIYPKLNPAKLGHYRRWLIQSIPKEIQVIFVSSKPKISQHKNQTITTCLFRRNLEVIGMGYSIENPNDTRDDEVGMRWAFKHSVQSMLSRLDYKKPYRVNKQDRKLIEQAFRLALWNARRK